jgi:crotonobetaine/carnitine-CoA ligase
MPLDIRGGRLALPLQEFAQRTVPDLLDRAQAFGLERPIWVSAIDGEAITYKAFLDRVSGVAKVLTERFPQGSRIACLMPNSLDYFVLRYALSVAGLTEVAVNTAHRGALLRHLLTISAPVCIFGPELPDEVKCFAPAMSGTELELVLSCKTSWNDRPKPHIEPSEASRILFTSGTSGASKAVEISHAYEVYTGERHVGLLPIGAQDRWLYVTPMFHIDAIYIMSILLHTGGAFAAAPNFSASRFWGDVEKTKATYFCYVGAILPILLKHPPPVSAHPLQYCVGGGATATQIAEFERRFGVSVVEAYAMTECIACTFSTASARKSGAAGKPVPGYQVRIADAEGESRPVDAVGEITVRSLEPFGLFTRYFGNAEATASAFRDGWFRTGDLGSIDAEGFLTYRGRLKDSIRVKGENVSAQELEAISESHPAVAAAAAIAVPSGLAEDDILLYAEPRDGMVIDPPELYEHIRAKSAKFMWPRYIKITARLPRTQTEKIRKQDLNRDVTTDVWSSPDLTRP